MSVVATALLCRIPSPQCKLYLGRGYDRYPTFTKSAVTTVTPVWNVVMARSLDTWTPTSLLDTVAETVIPHDLCGIWTFVGYAAVPLKILVNRVLFV